MCAWVGMQVSANVGRWVNVRVHVRVFVCACVRVCVMCLSGCDTNLFASGECACQGRQAVAADRGVSARGVQNPEDIVAVKCTLRPDFNQLI